MKHRYSVCYQIGVSCKYIFRYIEATDQSYKNIAVLALFRRFWLLVMIKHEGVRLMYRNNYSIDLTGPASGANWLGPRGLEDMHAIDSSGDTMSKLVPWWHHAMEMFSK